MGRMRVVTLLSIAVPFATASSQQDELLLKPGARLRWTVVETAIHTGERRVFHRDGWLHPRDGRSLVVRPSPEGSQPTIQFDSATAKFTEIVFVEAFAGSRRHTLIGAVVGIAAGATAGLLMVGSGGDVVQCGSESCVNIGRQPNLQKQTAVSLGAIGLVIGAVAGHWMKIERWKEVDLAGFRLRLTPQ